MRPIALFSIITGTLWLAASPARADVVAAYIEGHGGVSSIEGPGRTTASTSGSSVTPGLGFQLGARVLFLEGYFDRTAFGSGAAVSRGVLGVRAALGTDGLKLVLRGGGGVVIEEGGALAAAGQVATQTVGAERRGVVARAGLALEKRLNPAQLRAGLALDGEAFSLENPATPGGGATRTQGADVFLSLQIKFELGI